jgi:hypothetical protein
LVANGGKKRIGLAPCLVRVLIVVDQGRENPDFRDRDPHCNVMKSLSPHRFPQQGSALAGYDAFFLLFLPFGHPGGEVRFHLESS